MNALVWIAFVVLFVCAIAGAGIAGGQRRETTERRHR